MKPLTIILLGFVLILFYNCSNPNTEPVNGKIVSKSVILEAPNRNTFASPKRIRYELEYSFNNELYNNFEITSKDLGNTNDTITLFINPENPISFHVKSEAKHYLSYLFILGGIVVVGLIFKYFNP
ncbi:hypothetical protein [Tamlana flava]|uniref:hypothetical protein n=1 Tax=Tamlana flava TaxID=3158572 RepID=UPI00351B0759